MTFLKGYSNRTIFLQNHQKHCVDPLPLARGRSTLGLEVQIEPGTYLILATSVVSGPAGSALRLEATAGGESIAGAAGQVVAPSGGMFWAERPRLSVTAQAIVTADKAQLIDAHVTLDGSDGSAYERSLIVVKIA